MTSRTGVLYDVAAEQRRVTSLFRGGWGYILHNRGALLIGGSILEMQRVTSLTGRGVTHYTTWRRAVYRTIGRVLHTVSADGCEKLARRAQQRVTSLLGGVLHIAQP